jgi:hypothetical protein
MPSDQDDAFICFGVDVPITGKRQVIAMNSVIDNPAIVHHIVVGVSPIPVSGTPTPCPAGGFATSAETIYVWFPGVAPFVLPAEAGLPEEGTMHYNVQVHYNNVNHLSGQTDRSKIQLCTTDELRPNDADVKLFGTMNFTIPAHASLAVDCTTPVTAKEFPTPVHVIGSLLHMHKLGTSISDEVDPQGGGAPMLLSSDPTWDFNGQSWIASNATMQAGDTVRTRCAWSNPGDQPVSFGETTEDEMCFDFVMYYPKGAGAFAAPALSSTCTSTVGN